MAEALFEVQKGKQKYALLEKVDVKPAPRVCRATCQGMVCLSQRPQQSVLTEVHGVKWVVSHRSEHLPVMHELCWEQRLDHGLGYANGRRPRQASQMYFFGQHFCRLGSALLPTGIMHVAAGSRGWNIVGQDDQLYAYTWEGQPRWQWKMPPRVERRSEELIQFAMGGWRRPPLITGKTDGVWVSGGAHLRYLEACGTESWRKRLPSRASRVVDLTGEALRDRLTSLRAQSTPAGKPIAKVGYFCWEVDSTRGEKPAWEGRKWVPEDREEHNEDDRDDVEVASALASNREAVYVGTCAGELLAWSRQGSPQMRLRMAEGAVWNLCVDEGGMRAAQCGDTVIYFQAGGISGKSTHGNERPNLTAMKEELVLWTRHESWTADARGVVGWAARWDKPIVTCLPTAGGFAVLAGSGLYRFG